MGRFESTAPWYARFRPRYPAELIERLVAAAGLDRSSRVLDLGAGPGTRYRELLAGSPFSDVEEIDVIAKRTWTAGSLIGLAYSTSVASPERLGALRDAFEQRVREAFGDAEYHERVSVSALLGRRGDQRLEP